MLAAQQPTEEAGYRDPTKRALLALKLLAEVFVQKCTEY
jgi:hypothetical protein